MESAGITPLVKMKSKMKTKAPTARAHAKKAAQAAANYTGAKTYNAADSRAALADGIVANGDCATPGALDLPDGNPDAERVARRWNNRTNAAAYHIAAPWLLM